MCQSALHHMPDVDVVILLADRKRNLALSDDRIRLLWVEDLNFPDLLPCAFKYNIIEFNTALKPFTAAYLLKLYRIAIDLGRSVGRSPQMGTMHEV